MAYFLGIDTSNYTTSVALYDSEKNKILQQKKLLYVKDGTLGLKQSDAVFSHIKQLPELINNLFNSFEYSVSAVGVSVKPRNAKGSYMPCFLVGDLAATSICAVNKLPKFEFSHQDGHIMAALYSINKLNLADEQFIAFHFSGGTSECLFVSPNNNQIFNIEIISQSLDLKAGQAIDRVGAMLNLPFPAGPSLEKLAEQSQKAFKITPAFKGNDCCISGLENKCRQMLDNSAEHCDVARYCIDYISSVVDKMTAFAVEKYGALPLIYAGGVMSNGIIKNNIQKKYDGAYFAEPLYSSDNAAGLAVLAYLKSENKII